MKGMTGARCMCQNEIEHLCSKKCC